MPFASSLTSAAVILTAMAVLAAIEILLPLRARGAWSKRHLLPNLALTLITFATSMLLNLPIIIGLAWLESRAGGLLNQVALPVAVEIPLAIVVLDFAWYLTHVAMHKIPLLWRFHAVHHSDPAVDVTTTIRQHPGEGVVRYAFMAVFVFGLGASAVAFALYRLISALQGLFAHANLRLPLWLDRAISLITPSPNMHKVHHSTEIAFADSNFSNILSVWDRLFGTFTPPDRGRNVSYGLGGAFEAAKNQTALGLLRLPFRGA